MKCQTASRKLNDKTGPKKNAATTRTQLEDPQKREKNRILSKANTVRRLEADQVYRERNSARAKARPKQADNISRAESRTMFTENKIVKGQDFTRRRDGQKMQPIIDNALHGLQLQEKQSYPKKENIGDRTMLHLKCLKPMGNCTKIERHMTSKRDAATQNNNCTG